jgi:hypothetical protein
MQQTPMKNYLARAKSLGRRTARHKTGSDETVFAPPRIQHNIKATRHRDNQLMELFVPRSRPVQRLRETSYK